MMKTKQMLSLLLTLALAAGVMAGCGRTAEAPHDSTGRYVLSEQGEAVIDDIDLSHAVETADDARAFYEIFVGSFSDSNGDGIGDLRGIIERMDYLNDGDLSSGRSLGVEGIWLTPIFVSPSYHKYDVTDYYTIDPAFGTEEDLRELCELCESRNVKLIIDLVLNHTGSDNAWFRSFVTAHQKGDTSDPYYDFYTWYGEEEPLPANRRFQPIPGTKDVYECNFSDSMPELNYDSDPVRQEMLNVAKYWLNLGVDGFRFDAAKYIYFTDDERSAAFWDQYLRELRSIKSDIYTVAEVWSADNAIERYTGAVNCFAFSMAQPEGAIAKAAKGGNVGVYAENLEQMITRLRATRSDALPIPFVANHDMDRAAGFLPVDNGQMAVAANIYLLGPGSPFLYYGEEIGLRGSRGGADTDANRRLAMQWGDGDTVADPVGSTYSSQTEDSVALQLSRGDSLYSHYKRLLTIRRANPEIARGDYHAVEIPDSKVGGFVSTWNGSSVCVLHNTTAETQTFDLAALGLDFAQLQAVVGRENAVLDGRTLTLGAQTSVVLR